MVEVEGDNKGEEEAQGAPHSNGNREPRQRQPQYLYSDQDQIPTSSRSRD